MHAGPGGGKGEPQHTLVKRLLFACLDLPVGERAAYIETHCADPSVRAEVASLLSSHERAAGFLEAGLLAARNPAAAEEGDDPSTPLPDRIGPYTVHRRLGTGAMGVIYLARQPNLLRWVAIKVLRNDCGAPHARRRFRREARILSRLQHPAIAQIFEANVSATAEGDRPYLVMEYVEGSSLWEHCNGRRLDTRERLELVLRVAEGVQYAHERGILHRDLKPDNILVTKDGDPKILDFGVARILDDEGDATFRTVSGQILGTAAYMSPEQARSLPLNARSDVFSLACIAYELLCDALPFPVHGHVFEDLVARREGREEPFPLSRYRPQLAGDLEVVLRKALDPEPARRYPTARALAEDLRRYLEGYPVEARPPTQTYRLRRLISRHRTLFGALATVLLTLVLALAVTFRSLSRVRASERAYLMLADLDRIRDLEARLEELWPLEPATIPAMDTWLDEAEELRSRWRTHVADLEHLSASENPSKDDYWGQARARMRAKKAELVEAFEAFFTSGDGGGLPAEVRYRRGLASEVARRTLEEPAELWRRAIEAIANPEIHPRYRGLTIEPQLGLVPLGPDPESGLEEFALWGPTGSIPRRRSDGHLDLGDQTTLVFVLLPPYEGWIGVQNEDPEAPNYYPYARWHEMPPRPVELAPFFLSKYELTQSQWIAIEGSNPSSWSIGENTELHAITPRNPVEHVSPLEARAYAKKIGCTLPTEAQWEAASRAGSDNIFWGFEDPVEIAGHANLYDRYFLPDGTGDDYLVHAPVGSFPPNPYGLYDLIGNLSEICLDTYKVAYLTGPLPLRAGTGEVLAEPDGDVSLRGATFATPPGGLFVALRDTARENNRTGAMGLRPARLVRGPWHYASPPSRDATETAPASPAR